MARSTARASPPHACSQCTLSSGHGSSSGSGWACGPSRRCPTELPSTGIRTASFGQLPAEFLGVVVAAWHDGAHGQDSQLVLQQVEERDRVVKVGHEQHAVLIGDLSSSPRDGQHCRLIRGGASGGPDPVRVDFCIQNVACLGITQQEAFAAPSDRLVMYVLLHGDAVLGGNHALVEAELLAGAVVAAEEREHSVEHGPDFVNLAGLVHGLVRLIDQVQEAPEGDEAVTFHDFPETGGVRSCGRPLASSSHIGA